MSCNLNAAAYIASWLSSKKSSSDDTCSHGKGITSDDIS